VRIYGRSPTNARARTYIQASDRSVAASVHLLAFRGDVVEVRGCRSQRPASATRGAPCAGPCSQDSPGGVGHRMRCKKLIKVIFVLGGLCSMDGIKSVSYDAWARWYEYHMRSSSVQKQIKSRTLPIDPRVYICAEEVAGLIRSTCY
jgi:hypothetical protein